MLHRIYRALAAATVLGLLTQPAFAQGKTGTVKIGINEQLSGTFVSVGVPPAGGVKMAIKEINDKGGFVVGDTTYRLQVIEVDNKSQTATAVAAMNQLVNDDKVSVVFGPTLGALAVQAQEISVAGKVINFSAATPWQTLGHLSGTAKPLLFGTQNPLALTSAMEVQSLMQLGVKKVAYISLDDDTTKGNLPAFLTAAKNAGLAVETILVPPATTDWSSFVTRAKGENVDGIYFLQPQVRAPDLLRAILELKVPLKAFGGRALEPTVALKANDGKPLPFVFFSQLPTPSFEYPANSRTKAYADRLKAFDARAAGANAGFSFWTYDYVFMLVDAMKKAGTVTDNARIADALGTITYDGVAGKICFGKEIRTASLDGGQVHVRDGKIEAKAVASICK